MANWLTAWPKMLITAGKHEHEGQKVHGKKELYLYIDSRDFGIFLTNKFINFHLLIIKLISLNLKASFKNIYILRVR